MLRAAVLSPSAAPACLPSSKEPASISYDVVDYFFCFDLCRDFSVFYSQQQAAPHALLNINSKMALRCALLHRNRYDQTLGRSKNTSIMGGRGGGGNYMRHGGTSGSRRGGDSQVGKLPAGVVDSKSVRKGIFFSVMGAGWCLLVVVGTNSCIYMRHVSIEDCVATLHFAVATAMASFLKYLTCSPRNQALMREYIFASCRGTEAFGLNSASSANQAGTTPQHSRSLSRAPVSAPFLRNTCDSLASRPENTSRCGPYGARGALAQASSFCTSVPSSLNVQRPIQLHSSGPERSNFPSQGLAGNGWGGGAAPERFAHGFGSGSLPGGRAHASSPPWFDGPPQQMRSGNRQNFGPGPAGVQDGGGSLMRNSNGGVDASAGGRRSLSPDPRGGPSDKRARMR